MTAPTNDTVQSLQRSNRMLRVWLSVVSAVIGVQMLGSLVGQDKAIDAMSVVIRDRQGRGRIALGCTDDDRPVLALYSASGVTLGEFTVSAPLVPDKNGKVDKTREASLVLRTSDAEDESSVSVGGSGINLNNAMALH